MSDESENHRITITVNSEGQFTATYAYKSWLGTDLTDRYTSYETRRRSAGLAIELLRVQGHEGIDRAVAFLQSKGWTCKPPRVPVDGCVT